MTNFDDSTATIPICKSLACYYREYDRLMRHWNALLPGRIYECRYETLIADQEERIPPPDPQYLGQQLGRGVPAFL